MRNDYDNRPRINPIYRLDGATNQFVDTVGPEGNRPFSGLGRAPLPTMKELLEREMEYVQYEAVMKIQKLKHAPDIHCGLEVFHLFVLDLLGVRPLHCMK